jgi:hypothetical protein
LQYAREQVPQALWTSREFIRTNNVITVARDVVDIRHIDHIHNGPYDVTQLRTGVAKGCRDRSDGGHHLRIGIAIEVLTAGRRS